MVALDVRSAYRAALDDVGIYRPLRQKTALVCRALLLEHAHKFFTYDLAFFFGLGDSCQSSEKAVRRVHAHQAEGSASERGSYLLSLILPHHAVIHKDAGEPVGHGAFDERRRHGGVHPAGQPEHYIALPHLFADGTHRALDIRVHGVVALCPAHLVKKIADDTLAAAGALHFGVELYAVKFPLLAGDGGAGTVLGDGGHLESLGDFGHIVRVAHKGAHGAPDALEQHAGRDRPHLGNAVLRHLAGFDCPAQRRAHHLHTVTYAEYWYPQPEERGIRLRRVIGIYAERSAREYYADGRERAYLFGGRGARQYHGVHSEPARRTRDELLILPSEIKHQYGLPFRLFSRNH